MKHGFAWVMFGVAVWLLPSKIASAQKIASDPALYTCKVTVTGTDMRSRPAGLEQCVRDVLVKVAGDPDLAADPRVAALGERAIAMVQDFAYLDEMTDVPTHDEQGTRDRPFDLIGHVSPRKVAAVLRELGRTPWVAVRPRLLALVDVQRGDLKFKVTADGPLGERQREAILAAGETYGMRVSLPTLAEANSLDRARPALTGSRTGAEEDKVVLMNGSLVWSDADAGWVCTWRLDVGGHQKSWTVRGVSFDEGFRSGVGGAAKEFAARAR